MALVALLLVSVAAATTQALCPHEATDLLPWSAAASWNKQTVPSGGDITIDRPILLDVSPAAMGTITITAGGRLVFDATSPTTLTLSANMVELSGGEFWIGSEDCPYTGDAEVLLTGTRDESEGAPGVQKAVVVHQGVFEVHGQPKLSWTNIDATVRKTSRREVGHKAIYSAVENHNGLRGRGLFMVEFNGTGHLVRNWKHVVKPSKFFRRKQHIGNIVVVVVRSKAFFGRRFSPEEIAAAFEDLCYDRQRTSALRSMENKELTAFAAICHIGFPENSVEAVGTVSNDRSQTGLLVQRIGDVEFAAMSVVSPLREAHANRIEVVSYPAGGSASLERVLKTVNPVDSWKAGDRIVLASTDFDYNQAEEFEILECDSCTANEVKIMGPVLYTHWGEVTDGVDMRAEVGVLTRNVRFHGRMEESCYGNNLCDIFDYDTFGGQIKIHQNFTSARIENAEFYHMGQQSVMSSYPIHFHMCLDTSEKDAYVRNNSIHHTFSRCVTVHGTHNLTVEGNIAYHHLGHCYFVEDGGEQHNQFIGNLGLSTKPGTLLPTDGVDQVSTFWIASPNNILINNRAAGSEGIGVWFLLAYFPTGHSAKVDMGLEYGEPFHTLIPAFHGNRMHSNRRFGLRLADILYDNGTVKSARYTPLEDAKNEDSDPAFLHLDDLVAYKNFEAVWIRSYWTLCTNFRLAENTIGIIFASALPMDPGPHYEMLANSRIVGDTDNKGEPEGLVTLSSGEVVVFGRSRAMRSVHHAQLGVAFYRGTTHVVNTSFAGFKGNALRGAGAIGKKLFNEYFTSPISSVRNVTFDFADPDEGSRFFDGDGTVRGFKERDGNRHNIVLDVDGSLTTVAGTSVVRPLPLLLNARCVLMPTWGPGTALCPDRFIRLNFDRTWRVPTFMTRDDLMSSATETPLAKKQISYSLNTRESYILHFNTTVPHRFKLTPYGLELGLQQVLGVCVGVKKRFKVIPDTYKAARSREEVLADDNNTKYFYDSAVGVITFRLTHPYPRGASTLSHCPGVLDEDLNGVCDLDITIIMRTFSDDGDCRQRAYPAYQTPPVTADGALTVPVFQ
ncbi:cell migration-inducing and hyaluronan-binding protein-like [Amphibalanus amphitrite]|uniref:cell migration-inducing and hyaluronan-binding protein-like n=1 Tax=Amphibalanus amphitrite TaxID=1232801 RepID=UPI001C90C726|nr:cell migration-inducing and hyaluronan-binding protein-like [Amphibalanus amphitrite]